MSWYRDQLERYLSKLDIQAHTVIDIGGGAKTMPSRVRSWDVKNYHILDNGAEKNLSKSFAEYAFYDLNRNDNEFDTKGIHADIVFCLEVFEYIYNPVQALENIKNLLRGGGVAYVTFPFVYPAHEPVQYDYLRYTEKGIIKLLSQVDLGLKTLEERKDKSGMLQAFYRADGMHPAKTVSHDVTGFIVELVK